jgi:hypothetical protein
MIGLANRKNGYTEAERARIQRMTLPLLPCMTAISRSDSVPPSWLSATVSPNMVAPLAKLECDQTTKARNQQSRFVLAHAKSNRHPIRITDAQRVLAPRGVPLIGTSIASIQRHCRADRQTERTSAVRVEGQQVETFFDELGAAKFTVNRRVGDSILMEVFVDGKPYRGSFGSREKSRSETPTFRDKDTKPSAVPFSPESKRPTFSLPISQGVLTMSNSCAAI